MFPAAAWTETIKPDSLRYNIESRATVSGGEHTPFWLVNNMQGLGSPEKNSGYVRSGVFKNLDKTRRFSWGAGVELAGSWNNTSPFFVHQLYAEMKYRSLGMMIGAKEIWGEFNDPRLSSGNLLYSGNALPIPQLRVGIFDYADVWGCHGWFAAKGYVAYGMFTDSNWQESWTKSNPQAKYTKGVMYHSKGLWLRGGNTDVFPLQGELGIEMATQFGGKSYLDGHVVSTSSRRLKGWLHALWPSSEKRSTHFGETTTIDGNMLGAYNIALSWMPKADWSVKAYYEHYFEDQSQMTFEYGWKDGLYGVEVQLPRNRFVNALVYEYLYTKDQTGAVNNNATAEVPEQVSGRDNYYNHSVFSGWQHWGMGIGNPLIVSPVYNSDHSIYFKHTRVIGHHLGISGSPTSEINWRLLLSYTKSWGTYHYPTDNVKENYNGLLEVKWTPRRLKGWHAALGMAADGGNLLGRSFGCALTIGKCGSFGFGKTNNIKKKP